MLFTDDWYQWLTEHSIFGGWIFVDTGCSDFRYKWISPEGRSFPQKYRNRLCEEVELYIRRYAAMAPSPQERTTCLECCEYIDDCVCGIELDS
uniref:Uncharacterized protein n=1 Tax=viral metagenome TaxID=1070528 RepID=A0A6M3LFK4_9ZZZZ